MRIKDLSLEEKQRQRDISRVISDIHFTLKEDAQIKTKDDVIKFLQKNYKEYIREFGKTKPTLLNPTTPLRK